MSGSRVPDGAISIVTDPGGGGEADGDADGDGLGGRLASTVAVLPMRSTAAAMTAAMPIPGTRELLRLRTGHLPIRLGEPRLFGIDDGSRDAGRRLGRLPTTPVSAQFSARYQEHIRPK